MISPRSALKYVLMLAWQHHYIDAKTVARVFDRFRLKNA